jgi:hypothetical protein
MEEYHAGIENGGVLIGVKPHSREDARYFEQQWSQSQARHAHA